MRLIDADALIHEIKECLWDWDSVDGITATTVLKQTISDIENMPTIEPEQGWIPDACKYCANHPSNGGNGICHCTLGSIVWT